MIRDTDVTKLDHLALFDPFFAIGIADTPFRTSPGCDHAGSSKLGLVKYLLVPYTVNGLGQSWSEPFIHA